MSLDDLLRIPHAEANARALGDLLEIGVFLLAAAAIMLALYGLMHALPARWLEKPKHLPTILFVVVTMGGALGVRAASAPALESWLTSDLPMTSTAACNQAAERVLTESAAATRMPEVVETCGVERTLTAAFLLDAEIPDHRRRQLERLARRERTQPFQE